MKKLIMLLLVSIACIGQDYYVSEKSDSTEVFAGDTTCNHEWVYGEKVFGAVYATFPPIYTYNKDRICSKCLRRESFYYEERTVHKKTLFDSLEELLNKKIKPETIPYNPTPIAGKQTSAYNSLCLDTCCFSNLVFIDDTLSFNTKADTTYYDYIAFFDGQLGLCNGFRIYAGWIVTQRQEVIQCYLPNGEFVDPNKILFFLNKGEQFLRYSPY